MDIEFELSIDEIEIDTDELLNGLADKFAEELSSGGSECPAEGCDSDLFHVEMWATDGGGLGGEAVCLDCNSQIVLDNEDSGVKSGLNDVERAFKNMF